MGNDCRVSHVHWGVYNIYCLANYNHWKYYPELACFTVNSVKQAEGR